MFCVAEDGTLLQAIAEAQPFSLMVLCSVGQNDLNDLIWCVADGDVSVEAAANSEGR